MNLHKAYVKHLNCKLYYQQLHLKYLCNLARYRLQTPWGWHNSVETCSSVIICEIIVHLLVTVQNNSNRVFIKRYFFGLYAFNRLHAHDYSISFCFCTTSAVDIWILGIRLGVEGWFSLDSLYSICDTKDFADELLPCSIWWYSVKLFSLLKYSYTVHFAHTP